MIGIDWAKPANIAQTKSEERDRDSGMSVPVALNRAVVRRAANRCVYCGLPITAAGDPGTSGQ